MLRVLYEALVQGYNQRGILKERGTTRLVCHSLEAVEPEAQEATQ